MTRSAVRTLAGCAMVLALAVVHCRSPIRAPTGVKIPAQSDWTDYGTILRNGELGDWDYQLFGGLAVAAAKKHGTYYLYYQGASGYRLADDTVTWRAIGVALSDDGINFTKYPGNPVLAYSPSQNGEEGAVSGGVTVDASGEFVFYYGANQAVKGRRLSVHADVRLAISEDGVGFVDRGVVLDHRAYDVWGSGDELFPIVSFRHEGTWYVYYLPNGLGRARQLGVAWGPQRNKMIKSGPALSGIRRVSAWGPGAHAEIDTDTFALFTNDRGRIETRVASYDRPDRLSEPMAVYEFDEVRQATFLLDEETSTWFMYYRAGDPERYCVKLASAGRPDRTPPGPPGQLAARPSASGEIELSWEPARDAETGIVMYRVTRDDVEIAQVKGRSYSDVDVAELTTYSYQVSAVNYHGMEGPRSVAATAKTPGDSTAPRIDSVSSTGATTLVVVFDEPVEETSAEDVANYRLSDGVTVMASSLGARYRTVTLTTSPQDRSRTYRLAVSRVRDRARGANAISPEVVMRFTANEAPGLVGCWHFDEGKGTLALDSANFRGDAVLGYRGQGEPAWTDGMAGGALYFDGVDDFVTIRSSAALADVTAHSHTFALWAQPQATPRRSANHKGFYSILTRGHGGLFYDANQTFRATVKLAEGGERSVSSPVLTPGRWYHLTMVVDSSRREIELHVNGREVRGSPKSYAGALADHGEADYYVATSDPLAGRWDFRFRGSIDEVRIFDRALGKKAVAALAAER